MAEVSLQKISKSFGKQVALEELTLIIPDGSFVVLLGPTGAGKTTTLRLISGLDKPDSGQILINGQDAASQTPAERNTAMVFQQYSLYPHLSVRDNLAFPLKSPMLRTPPDEITRKVGEVAEVLQISHKLDNKATELSGGEMQRVSIRRALVRNPQIYLMWQGLVNSVIIALGVIAVSMPLGLAGAFVITRLQSRFNGLLYGIMVSPLLTPGIILGISTLIFWREGGVSGGLFTAAVAQATYISSYTMLMFMARLKRQDVTLEEAAMDLGASHIQVFKRITMPFLRPTIFTAAVIAFLQSFENYNTTIFSIGGSHTLVTEIGARMRFGLSPAVNVIGIIFVALTIIFATIYVVFREREKARADAIKS